MSVKELVPMPGNVMLSYAREHDAFLCPGTWCFPMPGNMMLSN